MRNKPGRPLALEESWTQLGKRVALNNWLLSFEPISGLRLEDVFISEAGDSLGLQVAVGEL